MTVQAWLIGSPEFLRQAQQGLLTGSATALGSSQGTAFQCPTDFVVFTTVAGSTGCLVLGGADQTGGAFGPVVPGDTMTIVNHGANALSVYPQSGGKIANGAANAAFSVSATKTAFLVYIGSGNWAASVSA